MIYAVVLGVRFWTSTAEDTPILWDFAVRRSRKEGRSGGSHGLRFCDQRGGNY